MNNPRKVREIYFELKTALGGCETEAFLLKAAAELVARYDRELDTTPIASTAEHRRDFLSLDLTTAMSDGGWRIMRRESELMHNFYVHSSESDAQRHFGYEVDFSNYLRDISI